MQVESVGSCNVVTPRKTAGDAEAAEKNRVGELRKALENQDRAFLSEMAKRSGASQSSAGQIGQTTGITDNAAQLTARLVAASGQFAVRQVLADASGQLVRLRLVAAIASGEDAARARACVKRLEKLLARGNRKLRDLDKEDILKLQKTRAERKKQEKRAAEIKEELRKKRMIRQAIERGYLLGSSGVDETGEGWQPGDASDIGLDAQAMAMAVAEVAAESTGGGEVAGGSEGVAAAGGADASAAPDGGGMDIAV